MHGRSDTDETRPEALGAEVPFEEAAARLAGWGHPRPRRWLRAKIAAGRIRPRGEPPLLPGGEVWRALLEDECDKLYNQAFCALERIRSAADEDSVLLLALDDLPSAVEQAFSLAPSLAAEHLELLREYREERHRDFLRELGVGTPREARERAECLAFWEENAERDSDLRRTLFRLVREGLGREAGIRREGAVELDHERYMDRAIERGRENPAAPFGCVIVDDRTGEVVAEGVNDAAAHPGRHGEIVTIDRLVAARPDPEWERLVLYSTAEPCPMCMAAILWAGFAGVVYGTSIPTLVRLGWDQIPIRAEEVRDRTPFRDPFLLGGVREEACDRLFAVEEKLYGGAPHA